MASLYLYLSTFRRWFPFFFIGVAITCLLLSFFSDASIIRNSPLAHLSNGQTLIMPVLLTFFEVCLPPLWIVAMCKNVSAHRSNSPRAPLSEAIKKALLTGDAGAGLLVLLVVVVPLAVISVLLDLYFAFSVIPLATSISGLIWICVGFRLMPPIRLAPRLILLALSLLLILSVRHIDWNSRRPFVRDLLKIERGMTADEVDKIMKRYSGSTSVDSLLYMHKVIGPFYSDMGVVNLKNDKVDAVELEFD